MIDLIKRSSGPCDRAGAERALEAFYRSLVFVRPPREIIWTRSPPEFGAACAGHENAAKVVGFIRHLRRLPGRSLAWAPEGAEPRSQKLFLDATGCPTEAVPLVPREGRDEPDELGDLEEPDLVGPRALSFSDAVFTQFDVGWGRSAVVSRPACRAALGVLAECAAFFAGLGVAVLCERPLALRWSETGLPHSDDGPWAEYPSGWKEWAYLGARVTEGLHARIRAGAGIREMAVSGGADLVEALIGERGLDRVAEEMGPAIVGVGERDLRRRLLGAFGVERFVREFGEAVQADDFGTLYRVELEGDEALAVVKVVNATPERDGTFRDYWLRVPPTTLTAHEGVAWSFALTERQYRAPLVET